MLSDRDNSRLVIGGSVNGTEAVRSSGEAVGDIGIQDSIDGGSVQTL